VAPARHGVQRPSGRAEIPALVCHWRLARPCTSHRTNTGGQAARGTRAERIEPARNAGAGAARMCATGGLPASAQRLRQTRADKPPVAPAARSRKRPKKEAKCYSGLPASAHHIEQTRADKPPVAPARNGSSPPATRVCHWRLARQCTSHGANTGGQAARGTRARTLSAGCLFVHRCVARRPVDSSMRNAATRQTCMISSLLASTASSTFASCCLVYSSTSFLAASIWSSERCASLALPS